MRPVLIRLAVVLVVCAASATPAFAQFTDDPLTAGTPIKAVHITELRTAVNNVRSIFGLPAFVFTDPTLKPGATVVHTVHLTDLRAALNEVYDSAVKTHPAYTDPAPAGVEIRAVHIQELRIALSNARNAAPSFTKGADQTVAEDAGAQTVAGWATAISPGSGESGQTLAFVFDGNTNPALFSAGPSVAANGTLTYTPAANQHGIANLTLRIQDNGGTANGGINTSATQAFAITVTAVNDPPVAPDTAVAGQANVRLSVNGLLANVTDGDSDVNGCTPSFSLAAVSGTTSPAGGLVAISDAANGLVNFDPPPGVTGAVTFTYTVSDTGCPGTATSAPATVTVTVGGPVVWFVDSTAPAGGNGTWTGSNARAFQTLAQADAVNVASDRVFVINNNVSSISYAGGLLMQPGERLIGQGVTGASFDAVVLGLTPPSGTVSRPAINGVRPTLQGTTTLADGVTLTGVNFTPNAAVAAMTASALAATAAITIDQVIVSGAGGATNALSLTNVTATGAGALNVSNASFTNTSAAEVLVSGGNIPISLGATISSTAGRSVDIQNRTGGTITLSGGITDTGTGILLNANTGATINFTGGLTLSTTTNAGFTAMFGGTVTVTGAANTITTTTGTALTVSNATIGASGLTFRSIAANGAARGIVLNNTGASGGLTVTGNGGVCTPAVPTCSGGRIQNTLGSDDNSVTPVGTGIVLNNTSNVSLTLMRLDNHTNYAIRGTSVTGFNLSSSLVDGTNGTNVSTPFNDGSLVFFGATGTSSGMLGTSSITNSTIQGGFQRNIAIDNSVGVLNLTVTGNTIRRTSDALGDDGFFLEADTTANVTVNITGNTFARHGGDHINLSMVNNAVVDATISFNTLHGNYTGTPEGNHPVGLGQGIFLFGASFNGAFTYDVLNNNTRGNRQGGAIHVNKGSGTGTFSGSIQNNTIGDAAITGSGSSEAFGIIVGARGAGGSHTTLINNNQVRQYFDRGIVLEAGEGSAALNATVTSNTVSNFADAINSLHGIHSDNGILGTDTNAVCLAISGNSVATAGNEVQGGVDIRVRKSSTAVMTVRFPGFAGIDSTSAGVFLKANNPTATTVTVTGNSFTGGAACPLPP